MTEFGVRIVVALDVLGLDLLDTGSVHNRQTDADSAENTLTLLSLRDLLRLRVTLLRLANTAGEQNQAFAVLFKTGNIGLEGFFGEILAAGIDRDADCGRQFAGNAGGLELSALFPQNDLNATHLQLSE
jgi:hypothetical protein